MLSKLTAFIRAHDMIAPGDHIICAVSGGADSMALLWSMYLLQDKLGIRLSAAHYNHGLRGAESDEDEAFVRNFCDRYDIPLYVGAGCVTAGEKGLEAAAREARYAFFATLDGKIATAHTADDNAETVLLHLIRGTGLKGLGGIAPVRQNILRPMLNVTRQEVLELLEEYAVAYRTDSSNHTDAFLRNRLRHHVMPLLKEENPRLAENLSAMAQTLRQDEAVLQELASGSCDQVSRLREMPGALRSRALEALLRQSGVREPERSHIALAESLVFSQNPSAQARFPGNVTLQRCYDTLIVVDPHQGPAPAIIACPGVTELPQWGIRVRCVPAEAQTNLPHAFTAAPVGTVWIRSRQSGDCIRLSGGTKTLKKLYIDRKIPAYQRPRIPVLADDSGILGIDGIGADLDRLDAQYCFIFEPITNSECCE